MSVRAKFKVDSVTPNSEGHDIRLSAVYGDGNPENAEFFKYTPSGSLYLWCANPEASKQFEVGKQFYIDFTEAE